MLDLVDVKAAELLHGFNHKKLLLWNETILETERTFYRSFPQKNPELTALVESILICGQKYLASDVLRKKSFLPKGPFFVPSHRYDQPDEVIPVNRIHSLTESVTCLTLAWYFSGNVWNLFKLFVRFFNFF